jgi:hypothetical protein
MIPHGAIFNQLRSMMLVHFPEGSKAVYQDSETVGDWLSKGSGIVTSCTKSKVTMEAPTVEFGSILLTEIENLLNHCFEHLQELGCISQDTRIRSGAWNTVTAYYFAFFSGSALLRLLGVPIVFLGREQLSSFPIMLGSGSAPSQGAFKIIRSRSISATHAEYCLTTSPKIHEATWNNLLQLFDELNRKTNPNPDTNEVLFYNSLCTKVLFSKYVNFQWLSSVRNKANYRPGFEYKLHIANSPNRKLINDWADIQLRQPVQIVTKAVSDCSADKDNFSNQVRLMVTIGTCLFLLVRELYAELLVRKSLDKRWEQKRKNYRKKMIFSKDTYEMLVRTF